MAFNKLILALLLLSVGAMAYDFGAGDVYATTTRGYNPGCWTPAWNTTYGRYNFIDGSDNGMVGVYYYDASAALTDPTTLTNLGLTGTTILRVVHSEDASGNRTAAIWAHNGAAYTAVFQVSTHDKVTNEVYTVPDLYINNDQPNSPYTHLYCTSTGSECVPVFDNGTDFQIFKVVQTHSGGGDDYVLISPKLSNTTVIGTIPNNNMLFWVDGTSYFGARNNCVNTVFCENWAARSITAALGDSRLGWSNVANITDWSVPLPTITAWNDFRIDYYGCGSGSQYNATFQTVEGNPVCPNGPIIATCNVGQTGTNITACTSSYTSSALSFSSNRPNIPEGLEGDAAIPKQFFKFRNYYTDAKSYLTTGTKSSLGYTDIENNVVIYEYPEDTNQPLKIKFSSVPPIAGATTVTVGRLRFTSDVSISGIMADNVTMNFDLDAKPWCNYSGFPLVYNNFDGQIMLIAGYNNTAYKEVSAKCNGGAATNYATRFVYDLNDFYGNNTDGNAIISNFPYETTPVTLDQVNGNVEQFVLAYINISNWDSIRPICTLASGKRECYCDYTDISSYVDKILGHQELREDCYCSTAPTASGLDDFTYGAFIKPYDSAFCVTNNFREQNLYIRNYNVTYQANLSSVAQCTAPGLANGAYNYLCTTPSGYNSTAASGTLTISNSDTVIPVYYQKGVSDDYFVAIRLKQYSGAPVVGATCQSDKWGYVFSDIHGLCNFTTASPATTTTIKLTGVQGEQLLSFGLTSGDQYGLCFDGSSYVYCPTANRTTEVCDSFSGGYTYDYKVYPGGLKPMNFFVGSGTLTDFKDHPVNGAELSIDAGNYSCTTGTTGFCQAPMTYDFIAHTAVVYHPDYTNTSAIFYDSIDDTVYINAVLKGEEQRKKEEPKVVDYTGLITLAMSGDGVGLGGSLILGIIAVVLTGGSVVFGGIAFTAGIVFFTIAGLLNPIWAFLVALIAALGTAAMVAGLFAKGG
jgi:hypothetical protein